MPVIGTILTVVAVVMMVTVLVTVHLSLRRQDRSIRIRLNAENKMLRQDNDELTGKNDKLLKESSWYRAAFCNTEDMVFVHPVAEDMTPGSFVDVNEVACKRLQYSRDEILKKSPLDIGYDQSAAAVLGFSSSEMAVMSDSAAKDRERKRILRPVQNLIKRILEQGEEVYERRYVPRDKSEFPVEVKAKSFEVNGKPYIMLTASDITNRRETEEALKESEDRLRNFFDQSPIGIALYDANKSLESVNLAFLRIMGVPDKQEFQRFNIFDFSFIPEHIREKVRAGESIRIEVKVDFDEVRTRRMFISTRTGEAFFDLMINNLGRGRDFKPRGFLVQVQDNTQRNIAEQSLRQSESQLRQAEKMEAIGSMAGGIAHDFNNILTPILGYTELTLRMCDENDSMHKFMEEIMKASHRAKDLVNQILTFSRQKDKDGQPIRVLPIIKEVLNLMRATLPDEIDIKRIIKTEHDNVLADPTQIHQVLMNLCTNAWHAMKEKGGGTLEVRVSDFMHEKGSKGNLSELVSGRYLQISVSDTGTGMRPEVIEKIFDPFFTTKKSGEGTGMGLSVVRNIVTSFKGKIVVDSKPGEGSEFRIVLPTIEDSARGQMAQSSMPLQTGTETILLVDDDPSILEMVERMLETLGYKSVCAKLGQEALDLFKENPDRYDVVITDQVMPGMQGNELATEIFAIKPDTPIVLCTGFSESVSADEVRSLGVTDFLKKPIIMRDLSDVIRSSIDAKKV